VSRLASKVTDVLCRKKLIEEEDREIYEFGYEIIIANIGKTLILLIAGILLHKLIFTSIFIIVFTSLRSCSGGYHAKKSWQCDVMTLILWSIAIWSEPLVKIVVKTSKMYLILLIMVSELVIYQYAPVEHINNRLTKEKRARNRRQALIMGSLYGILILLFSFKMIDIGIVLTITMLEVAILMIIPNEGRVIYEKTEHVGDGS